MSHYDLRPNYEQQYRLLMKERGVAAISNLEPVSDFQLLNLINRELEHQGCIRMNSEELEKELQ